MSDKMAHNDHEKGREHYPDLRLTPVTSNDIPALVRIHKAAFETDQFCKFMLYGRDKNTHQIRLTKSLASSMSDQAAQVIQALDNATGQVLGWACWVKKGEKAVSQDPEPSIPQQDVTQAKMPAVKEPMSAPMSARQKMVGRMLGDEIKQQESHMKGVYMVLQRLATDPEFQRRGVGSKLVKWGLDRADAEGLPCWLHVSDSDVACRLYEAAGFRQVGHDEYNLDACAAESGSMSSQCWGTYTFRYMVREGKTIGETPD